VNGRRAEWAESCRRATVGDNEIANGGHREHQGVGVLVGPRKPPGPASAPETARVKGERIIASTGRRRPGNHSRFKSPAFSRTRRIPTG